MTLALNDGDTWLPHNGERPRQIGHVWTAAIGNKYAIGTEVVTWTRSAGDSGYCTARSFRRWIKYTKATKL